jgi:hypothetical protein
MTTPAVWRCPVCEGINHGGRRCITCGEQLPDGYTPQAADRHISPSSPTAPTTTPVATPRPRAPKRFEDVFGSPPPDSTWW